MNLYSFFSHYPSYLVCGVSEFNILLHFIPLLAAPFKVTITDHLSPSFCMSSFTSSSVVFLFFCLTAPYLTPLAHYIHSPSPTCPHRLNLASPTLSSKLLDLRYQRHL